MTATARNIAASQLASRWSAVLDDIRQSRHPWVVTERGQPVARVVPWPEASPQEPPREDDFRDLLGSVRYEQEEDLLAPVEAAWDADT